MEDDAGDHHRSRRDAGGGDREKDRHSCRDDGGGGDREKDRHSRRDGGGGDREKDRHSRRNDGDREKDRHSRRDDGDREKERHSRRDDDGVDREKDRRSRRDGEKDRRSLRESERDKDRESRRGDGEREKDRESRRDESKKKQKDRELRSGNSEKDREWQHEEGEKKDLELRQCTSEKEKDREFSRRDRDRENDQELRRGDIEKDQGLVLDDAEREKDQEPRRGDGEKEKDRESRRDNSKKEKEKDRESRRDNSRKEKEEGRESRHADSEKETDRELRPDDAEREKDRELMHDDREMEKEQEVKCGDVEKRKEGELRHDDGEREKEKDRESKHVDGVMEKEKDQDSRRGDQEKDKRRRLERNNEERLERRKEREMTIEEKLERRTEREVSIGETSDRRKEREKSIEERPGRRKEREMSIEERPGRRKEREKSIEERPERRKERDMSSEERHERERERRKEKEREREKAREREREERRRAREWEEKDRRAREERDRRRRDVDGDRDDEERDRERKRRRREDSRERAVERRDRAVSEEARRKKDEAEAENAREVDPEEEQRRLDEEMEKRRRRVQEWQELRKKKLEEEKEKSGVVNGDEQPEEPGKKWTLEGESDDEEPARENVGEAEVAGENGDTMDVDGGDGKVASHDNEEEIDPLDAFMNALELPEDVPMTNVPENLADGGKPMSSKDGLANGDSSKKGKNAGMGRIIPGEESASDYSDVEDEKVAIEDEDDEEFMKRVKKSKVEKLSIVDHSKIQYPPFKKNFYIEVKEIARMTVDEVAAYRKQLELKMHGKDVPKPVKTWNQTGLNSKILDMIKKLNFEKPMPIQAQALPIIMSGRDCIGIAKTGSGKTLAFVLPMLRHIKDQPPVVPGDGPVGLIMAPTRELVQQIHSDIKKFAKVVGLNCVPVYGGSGVAQQISELKRGAEIVVCTPGRMIDILCTSSGKITNLRRVTYLVMDEADRMFDMGFEPQITRIVQNTRPDRQTVLFSATFPRQVEILARKVLNKPVEIQVGGRSVVNKDITQLVEVRQETDRFWRLLELLGEWYEKGKILVFVHSQEKCDSLFRDLLKHGYPCLSLHGAKDQTDRESTISDFKSNVCNLMIATSVAARGLDVKELELVVNFDVPNHYEDYVHRVGRTGRAGRKGCAITFISEDDARYAPDLVKALELSEQAVPQDLKALADGFMAKVNQGTEHAHGTGYGGSGFKFNEEEDEARKAAKKAQAREYGFEEDKSDSDSEDDGVQKAGADVSQAAVLAQALAAASKAVANSTAAHNGGLNALAIPGLTGLPNTGETAAAAAIAAALNLRHNLAKIQADAMPEHYHAELDINDFPQNARWRVTHKETLGPISDFTGAAITTRGTYCPPGKVATSERKLYLYIEGPTESSVKKAKAMLKQVLEDCTQLSLNLSSGAQPGKYSLL